MVLAALPAIVVALLALLLIWAFAYFVKAVAGVMPTFGIPGLGSIRNYVITAATEGIALITDLFHAVLAPLRTALQFPILAIENMFNSTAGVANSLGSILSYSVRSLLPSILGSAYSFTIAQFNTAIGLSYVLYNQLAGIINAGDAAVVHYVDLTAGALTNQFGALFHTAEADISTLATNLTGYVNTTAGILTQQFGALFNRAEGDVAVLGNNLVGYVNTTAATLADQTVKAFNAAEAFAETTAIDASAAAIKAVDIDVAAIEAAAWPDVIGAVDGVIGAISTDFPDIRALWQAIPRDIPTTVPLAIAGIGALALPLVKYMEDCGVPLCNNLHDFSGLIGGLGQLIGDAGLLALLVEAVRDPSGTARTVEDLIGGAVHATADALTSALGI